MNERLHVLLVQRHVLFQEGFRRLAEVCTQRGVAVQIIKSICRRPWPEGAERKTTTWYEALTEEKDIALAARYVLAQPRLFLNTPSDVTLLPRILDAASRFTEAPADTEMRELLEAREMLPLWPE